MRSIVLKSTLTLLVLGIVAAFAFALAKAGKSMPAKMAMIAITTNNSIKVNAARRFRLSG